MLVERLKVGELYRVIDINDPTRGKEKWDIKWLPLPALYIGSILKNDHKYWRFIVKSKTIEMDECMIRAYIYEDG